MDGFFYAMIFLCRNQTKNNKAARMNSRFNVILFLCRNPSQQKKAARYRQPTQRGFVSLLKSNQQKSCSM